MSTNPSSEDSPETNTGLVLLNQYRSVLHYDLQKLPGAMKRAYLDSRTLNHLDLAAEFLKEKSSSDFVYELLIWDAYRTQDTQEAIYSAYAKDIAREENISFEEAYPKAIRFVSSPTSIFPHGTGGAIDLTLLVNGMPAEMGTEFDEFTPQSHKNYFHDNPPKNEDERQAHENREVLRSAMEHAGFFGLNSEWWHYEWGTKTWSEAKNKPIVLSSIYPNPHVDGRTAAYVGDEFPLVQPVWFSGIAQVFENAHDRASALVRDTNNHYYARTSHPSVHGLGNYIKEYVIDAQYVSLVTSGLNACRTALTALVPTDGVLVCDRKIYYEVGNEIGRLAGEFNWTVEYTDFNNSEMVQGVCLKLQESGKTPDVLYFDSPTNWWLECVDLKSIKEIANEYSCKTVVDISVQPLRLEILRYVDVVVFSLSKYPSAGLTLGGAILTNDSKSYKSIEAMISRTGVRLSGDTAATIWCQIVSMRDRMESLENKVAQIKDAVGSLSAIREVRTVSRLCCNDQAGGILVLDLKDKVVGTFIEAVVSHNASRKKAALHLAYTFGGVMTTLEHFSSNPRLVGRGNQNISSIPETFVRISVGYEPVEHIISDLKMVLNTALQLSKDKKL